jgi:hypothetical protein
LAVELRDEIAERAVGESKALGDIEQRLLVDNDGADGFIAFLLSQIRPKKELSAPGITHDRTSKMSHRKTAKIPLRDTRNCR